MLTPDDCRHILNEHAPAGAQYSLAEAARLRRALYQVAYAQLRTFHSPEDLATHAESPSPDRDECRHLHAGEHG